MIVIYNILVEFSFKDFYKGNKKSVFVNMPCIPRLHERVYIQGERHQLIVRQVYYRIKEDDESIAVVCLGIER